MLLWEIIPVYSENHIKTVNTFCEQNSELLNVKEGGIYSYHCVLKYEPNKRIHHTEYSKTSQIKAQKQTCYSKERGRHFKTLLHK
jgi:hypothetical protein